MTRSMKNRQNMKKTQNTAKILIRMSMNTMTPGNTKMILSQTSLVHPPAPKYPRVDSDTYRCSQSCPPLHLPRLPQVPSTRTTRNLPIPPMTQTQTAKMTDINRSHGVHHYLVHRSNVVRARLESHRLSAGKDEHTCVRGDGNTEDIGDCRTELRPASAHFQLALCQNHRT